MAKSIWTLDDPEKDFRFHYANQVPVQSWGVISCAQTPFMKRCAWSKYRIERLNRLMSLTRWPTRRPLKAESAGSKRHWAGFAFELQLRLRRTTNDHLLTYSTITTLATALLALLSTCQPYLSGNFTLILSCNGESLQMHVCNLSHKRLLDPSRRRLVWNGGRKKRSSFSGCLFFSSSRYISSNSLVKHIPRLVSA